jgi:hypothetical protein
MDNRRFLESSDADLADNPKFVDSGVRGAIVKELLRTDLSPEDRKAYEDALAKLRKDQ